MDYILLRRRYKLKEIPLQINENDLAYMEFISHSSDIVTKTHGVSATSLGFTQKEIKQNERRRHVEWLQKNLPPIY